MDTNAEYERWRSLLAEEPLPAAIIDLDAVEANLRTLLTALGDSPVTLRVASKSIRHVWLLRHLIEVGGERLRGLMTYSAPEAAFLADQGLDDFLMGYPVGRPHDARALAELAKRGATVVATLDDADHVSLLDDAAGSVGVRLAVCIDVDMSWRPLGGRLHLGVRRSPIRDVNAARSLARRVASSEHLELRAVLAYEAQIAGMADRTPAARHTDPIRRVIKERSRPVVAERRKRVVQALRADGHGIELVNGGGTGSVDWTAGDESVTEVTAGSGFLCPHLFDHYRGLSLRPAAFFAIPVVRRSDPDHVTCAFGGYIASGPPAADRAPVVHLPGGLSPLSLEGWGEVQTPFRVRSGEPAPALGDPVICRHAKGGELSEHFRTLLLVRGDRVVGREPTYRGMGFGM